MAYEYVMLALRLKDGFSLSDYRQKFGLDFLTERVEKINYYEKLGLMKISGDRIFLTERGFYLSNTIISDLI